MSSILVTGAGGLLGRALVEKLSKDGHQIHALVHKNTPSFPSEVSIHSVDLGCWPINLPDIQPDAVFHLAQSAAHNKFPERAGEVFAVSAGATQALLDYSRERGVKKFVLASSGGVYAGSNQPLTETGKTAAPESLNHYQCTKLVSEMLCEPYRAFMDIAILRVFFCYGPEQRDDMLIPRLTRSICQGTPITLQGVDGLVINPVFTSDAAAAFAAALSAEGIGTVNIAGDQHWSLRAIVECLAGHLGKKPVFEQRPGPSPMLVADTAKMHDILVTPAVDLAEGLRCMANAFGSEFK